MVTRKAHTYSVRESTHELECYNCVGMRLSFIINVVVLTKTQSEIQGSFVTIALGVLKVVLISKGK